ncbi:hypothetical protein GLOTRDRAFT_8019, partial [Gloeophyllum trabeum ATCC 11539]
DFSLTPVGTGSPSLLHISEYIAECYRVLETTGVSYQVSLSKKCQVCLAMQQCHSVLHQKGAPRVCTAVHIETSLTKADSPHKRVKKVKDILPK